MKQGYKYIVFIYADVESRRLVASAKLNKFLDNTPVEYEYNEEVDLLVTQKTDLGWKVIVNSRHSGMIYDNEIFVPIQKGDRIKGYVKHIRRDEKLDITLQKTGYDVEAMDTLAKEIFEKLKASGGIIPLSDKSSAEEIAEIFGCSKKSYKKAIGSLYKAKLINITPKTIELI
jgi:predicted RNA-binding protein (virulence factor B family)